MTDKDQKTSEDMIRDARSRLGEPGRIPIPGEAAYTSYSGTQVDESTHDDLRIQRASRTQTAVIPEPSEISPIDYETPKRRFRVTGRLLAWAVVIAVGLGWGLFTSLDNAERNETGEIVAGGDLDVLTVQVGDCFDNPGVTGVVYNLDAIPCSQPHDNEVFVVESVAGVWSDYPGQSSVDSYAYNLCTSDLFDDFVGTTYLDSRLDVFTLTPTSDSWDQGDREVVCALYRLDSAKLTGTARDSRL